MPDTEREAATARAADALAGEIGELLHGQSPELQGAVLADLTAIWLSGHLIIGSKSDSQELRQQLLAMHNEVIWQLVDFYDRKRGFP